MPKKSAPSFDVLIAGAGPAGLSLACALAAQGYQVALIEKQKKAALAKPAYDGREIALTHRSHKIMKELGIWQCLPKGEIHVIKDARVQDGTSPYALHFDHRDSGKEHLSYMVSNDQIRRAVWLAAQKHKNITLFDGVEVVAAHSDEAAAHVRLSNGRELSAPLLVAADSRFSAVRRMMGLPASMYDFGRVCIVCRMEHTLEHDGTAYECFNYDRTLAVLPLGPKASSVVITVDSDEGERIMALSPAEFAADIEARTEYRLGSMKLVKGGLYSYPLVAVYARRFVGPRFALMGDAAVGMHPVTAHGFNFGLRGVETFAALSAAARDTGLDLGNARLLARYAREHRRATKPLYLFTNGIVRLYTDTRPVARLARTALLQVSNRMDPIKKMLMRQLTAV